MTAKAPLVGPRGAAAVEPRADGEPSLVTGIPALGAERRLQPVPAAAAGRPPPEAPSPSAPGLGGSTLPARSMGEDVDLRAFGRLLRRRMVFILVTAGLVFSALMPPILAMKRTYSAQMRLLIDRPETVALASPDAALAGPLDLAAEIERLQSQSTVRQVIRDLDLASLQEFNPPPPEPGPLTPIMEALRRLAGSSAPQEREPEQEMDPVVLNFYKAFGIRRTGSSDVIEIGFTSQDPSLAAQVPNHLVEVYLAQRRAQVQDEVARARTWLIARADAQRGRVEEMDAAAARFRTENDVDLQAAEAGPGAQIATLTDHLAELTRSRGELMAALAELQAGNTTSAAIDAVASPLLAELRRDLQVQRRELTRLRQIYGENHSEVVSYRAMVEETEAAVQAEAEHLADSVRVRISVLNRERLDVSSAMDDARSRALVTSAKAADYEAMLRDLDRERATLAALEDQLRRLDSEAVLPVAEAEILSPASLPLGPDGRGRKFYLAVAIIAALCLATTAACIRELLDRSVRSQQQFWGLSRVITAGLVPSMKMRGAATLPEQLRLDQDGPFPDSIRWLALSLRQGGGDAMPRSILLTSALPGEGKSFTAVALALELAAAGQRVLLVDADLRGGTVHTHFRGQEGPGLADVLCGRSTLDAAVQVDSISGVEFLARGADPGRPLLDPAGVTALLEQAQATDRVVLFDSRPILASTETAQLATLVEQCVLVARWGRTPLRMAELALDRLLAQSRSPVAVVVNQVDPRRHARYSFVDSDLYSPALQTYRAGRA
ncbi:GumC family protein [Rubellimicrobium arenae]|uniref:GumC family protein n=1 Tax=Rubellimicrobium arenae TaxID=2817372 RepID=UPI001B305304|nr:polysaccharide biosynthesis tyrosine autokinase [Rubellimicrobium arenae]